MLQDEKFEGVAGPSVERFASLHGTPRGEIGVLDEAQIKQGEEIDKLIDRLLPWTSVEGITSDDAGVNQVFENIGQISKDSAG